jgi:hypothetical protein
MTTGNSGTFIEAVKESLAAAGRYNSGDSLPPAAILWTDAEGEWQPIVTRLRALMPEPGRRSGCGVSWTAHCRK